MSDSEQYAPPPPPYQPSLQHDHDHKVVIQHRDSEVSKGNPFQDEAKDPKHSTPFSDKFPTNLAIHTPPKCSAKSANGHFRVSRPLPPCPTDALSPSPGGKVGPVPEIKSYAAQSDHETEPHANVPPPFSAVGPSRDEASYTQSILHPGTSVDPSSFHHPSQPFHDTPRHSRDDRWRISAYSPRESSFRRSSHMASLSPSFSLPQNDSLRTRLSFDPSVAYAEFQANSCAGLPVQRGTAASLYSSAVSSHLSSRPCSDGTMTSGSRQYAPQRPSQWSVESLRIDKTDIRPARPHSSVSSYSSPPASLYTRGARTQSTYGYEQRWAISESDIARDVYHR